MDEKETGLIAITGCMFSGKTTGLLKRAESYKHREDTFVFSPDIDDRYIEGHVSSHNGDSISCISVDSGNPSQIKSIVDRCESERCNIFIDEGNLFSNSLINIVRRLSKNNRIVVSGLDLDFLRQPFSPMPQILSMADEVHKKYAVCEVCGEKANRTQRIVGGEPASRKDPLVLVGGEEKYEPRCRKCHIIPD